MTMVGEDATVRLESIASCFEGVIPSPLCTCSRDGIPNVTYLSIVHLIDETHVGLSVQFFNKTRRNMLENPRAQVLLVTPDRMDQYRLDVEFERTEASGPLFERVRSRLDAIASQSGMRDIFRLRGVDVCRVLSCRAVDVASVPAPEDRERDSMAMLAEYTAQLAGCRDLESLLSTALEQLSERFGYRHSFIMVRDEDGKRLFTLASHGFAASGVGSEVVIGEGLIGTAAERRMPIRSTNLARERVMSRALRQEVERSGDACLLEREIPLPGLPSVASQLVTPLESRGELLGVLCLQSDTVGRFLAADEPKMQILARQLAACMSMLGFASSVVDPAQPAEPAPVVARGTATLDIKYYPADDSVFVEDSYVIKGVPGRILHRLLRRHLDEQRDEFTNKEIRLDPSIKLPEWNDNLEARLILLRRRLEERCETVRLDRVGRGRLRLALARPVRLTVGA